MTAARKGGGRVGDVNPFRDSHHAAAIAEERAAEERAAKEADAAQKDAFAKRLRPWRASRLRAAFGFAVLVMAALAVAVTFAITSRRYEESVPRVDPPPGPRVTVYTNRVGWPDAPALTNDAVSHVIHARSQDLAVCYTEGLAAHTRQMRDLPIPGDPYIVRFTWFVERDGSVSRASVDPGTAEGDPLARCVLDHVRTWRFPASTATTEVPSWGFSYCEDRGPSFPSCAVAPVQ